MRWGIALTTFHPDDYTHAEVLQRSLEFARTADAHGYDDVWILEHHFTRYGLCPNSLTMAAFILGNTVRIKAGTAVIVAPFQHPIRMAEDIALVDQLSQGRLLAGFGRGLFPNDFAVFGVEAGQSHLLLREWVDVAVAAWTRGTVSWKSDLFEMPEVSVYPETYTKPHPPVYVVGESPSTIEWAAKRGFPLLLVLPRQIEKLRSTLELYDATAARPAPHALVVIAHVAATREVAQQEILDNMATWFRTGGDAIFSPEQLRALPNYRFHYAQLRDSVLAGARESSDVVRQVLDVNPVGSPQDCIDVLGSIHEQTGIDHFICGLEGTVEPTRILETIVRFREEVVAKVVG